MDNPKKNNGLFRLIQRINTLLSSTSSTFLIQDTRVFYDEPPFYFFSGLLTNNIKFLKRHGYCSAPENIVSGGFSFSSRPLAVLKCFAELAERFALYNFQDDLIFLKTYQKNSMFLLPFYYRTSEKKDTYGWITAQNIYTRKPIFIPAQLVYLNYYSQWAKKNNPKEPRLCQYISNGACFGFDKESTMLRGLYELIERDSSLTSYLVQYQAPRIDIDSISDLNIRQIKKIITQYRFQIFVFDMTQDLEIPTFLTVLVDKSMVGPRITAGLKASLNPIEAIIGSMEESFMGRTWVRHEILKGADLSKVNSNKITTRLERALLYATKQGYKNLQYLLKQKPKPLKDYNIRLFQTPKEELNYVVNMLTKKGYTILSADIRPSLFPIESCYIYKIIVPEFQQLYLNELDKSINEKRLNSVRRFFGIKNTLISTFPHPFL